MKTPLNWLRTHLRIWLGVETLAHRHSALKLEMYEHLLRAQNGIEQLHREQMALRGEIAMLKRESGESLKWPKFHEHAFALPPNYTQPEYKLWKDVRTEPLDTTFPFQSQHCEK